MPKNGEDHGQEENSHDEEAFEPGQDPSSEERRARRAQRLLTSVQAISALAQAVDAVSSLFG